jgi:uncharacterized protein (DUF2252 family)
MGSCDSASSPWQSNLMAKTAKTTTVGARATVLGQSRNLKMASSAHAYVRGNALKFYEWLDTTDNSKIPQGPPVWICGDCHVGNLGPVADKDGKIDILIRDLDQTVIGNPAHDLIRLGLSLAMAARGSDLPGVTTARMLEEIMLGYEEALTDDMPAKSVRRPECVQFVMRQAVERNWENLAKERIEDTTPTIPLGKRFWPLSAAERAEIDRIFATEEARRLVTTLGSRKNSARVQVLDAAYWMKGCSSLGRLRFAILLGVGKNYAKKGGLCLIDIKEAVKSAAPRNSDAPMPRDNAMRVVEGARHLSPALGERMLAMRFLDRGAFMRELLPQDLKLEIDEISREEAMKAAHYLAMVVGRAHARQMDAATRAKWRDELSRNRPANLDAPGWLWSSIVELVASHETAYLEHCRRYVADPALAA